MQPKTERPVKTREQSERKGNPECSGSAGPRRRALLAKIHIAAKELGMRAADYRALLMGEFGMPSAADLSVEEMERLVEHLAARGWRPLPGPPGRFGPSVSKRRKQAFALQARARQVFSQLYDTDGRRLEGLCEKICGRKDLSSCLDIVKLRRLLAVLEGIRRSESRAGCTLH
jgi:phage gp16-like protein